MSESEMGSSTLSVPGFTMPHIKLLSVRREEGVLFNFLKKSKLLT